MNNDEYCNDCPNPAGCYAIGKCQMPDEKEEAERPSDATACSRLPDPEGKHLEICRIQLAKTVMERDQARDKIKRASNALKHHHMARPGIAAIVQLLTENVPEVASHDLFSDLFAILDECGVKMVFWVCSEPSHRGVKWNASKTVATCQVCGKTNPQENAKGMARGAPGQPLE